MLEKKLECNSNSMKDVFVISVEDIQNIALKEIGRKLSNDELHKVKKGIEFGLEFWEDIVICAIKEITK